MYDPTTLHLFFFMFIPCIYETTSLTFYTGLSENRCVIEANKKLYSLIICLGNLSSLSDEQLLSKPAWQSLIIPGDLLLVTSDPQLLKCG